MTKDEVKFFLVSLAAVFGLMITISEVQPPKPTAKPSATPNKPKVTPVPSVPKKKPLQTLTTRVSYFWDDGSGINGDTGAPASGKPMQKGGFASPMWPMGTKVTVTYKGRTVKGEIIDMGPGKPAERKVNPVLLDLDTYTFRYLYDGKKPKSKYNAGVAAGHLKGVKVTVTKWGKGRSYKSRSKTWRP